MIGGLSHHLILPLTLYTWILGAEKGSYQLGTVSHPGNGPTVSFQPVEDQTEIGSAIRPVDLARRAVQHLAETEPIRPCLKITTIEVITASQENPENVSPLAI